jgi:hypothetical protein
MSVKITYGNTTKPLDPGNIATLPCKDTLMENDVVITNDSEVETWVLTLEDGSTVTKKVHIG